MILRTRSRTRRQCPQLVIRDTPDTGCGHLTYKAARSQLYAAASVFFFEKTITFFALRCLYIYICVYVYVYIYLFIYFVLICGSAVVSIVLCQFLLVYCSMSNTRGGLQFPEMKTEVVSHIADVHTRGVGMVGSGRVDDPISLV